MKLPGFNAVTVHVVCFVGVFLVSSCQSDRKVPWNNDVRDQAVTLIESGNCDGFWRLLLPYAKQGNSETASLLAGAIYSHGFVPPGVGDDVLFRYRSLASLFGQSAKIGEQRSVEMLLSLLDSDVFQKNGGVQLSHCLAHENDNAVCVDRAIADNLFPSFEQWVREVELLGKDGGTASCNQSPQSQKLNDRDFDVVPPK